MSEQAISAEADRQELLDELDRRQEEILRLRDLLIAQETELGDMKGNLAQLQDPRLGLSGIKHRVLLIVTRIPGLGMLRKAVQQLRRIS